MTVWPGRYSYLVVLAAILIVLAIIGQMGGVVGESDSWPPEYLVNRIAVVTSDGGIRTYQPGGQSELSISTESDTLHGPRGRPTDAA